MKKRVCTCMCNWVTLLYHRKKKLYWGNNKKNPYPQYNHRTSMNPNRRTFYQCLVHTPPECQSHEEQGKIEDMSQIGGERDVVTKCSVGS